MNPLPWDYSTPGPVGGVPNLPSPEGAALGRELARLVAGEFAKFTNPPVMCDECAFRAGTIPNQCASTLMDAIKCTHEGEPFYCHKGYKGDPDRDEPKRLCAGYVACTMSETAARRARK